jgi:hypothetical protein
MFDVLFAHAQGAVLEIEPKETKKKQRGQIPRQFSFSKKEGQSFQLPLGCACVAH